jgi:hypothetical protein
VGETFPPHKLLVGSEFAPDEAADGDAAQIGNLPDRAGSQIRIRQAVWNSKRAGRLRTLCRLQIGQGGKLRPALQE